MTNTTTVSAGQRWLDPVSRTVWLVLLVRAVVNVRREGSAETRVFPLSAFAPPWLTLLSDGTPAA